MRQAVHATERQSTRRPCSAPKHAPPLHCQAHTANSAEARHAAGCARNRAPKHAPPLHCQAHTANSKNTPKRRQAAKGRLRAQFPPTARAHSNAPWRSRPPTLQRITRGAQGRQRNGAKETGALPCGEEQSNDAQARCNGTSRYGAMKQGGDLTGPWKACLATTETLGHTDAPGVL